MIKKFLLLMLMPTIVFNANAISLDKDIEFKKNTSKVKTSMTIKNVKLLLGKPDKEVSINNYPQLTKFKNLKGFVYWHPEYSTIHFLVVVKNEHVVATRMCNSIGSRIQKVSCAKTKDYWRKNIE